ncbi:hypothetical protein H5410_055532 [Solanum commersonii]|uniref:Uncharacterized protein n=1 Tax=Solanum commersonii TaxID=4109 RepID=A0A9J5WKJ7_SOLCO|nr:hypothetical protein H5410_055532 [Solanum commersonii]
MGIYPKDVPLNHDGFTFKIQIWGQALARYVADEGKGKKTMDMQLYVRHRGCSYTVQNLSISTAVTCDNDQILNGPELKHMPRSDPLKEVTANNLSPQQNTHISSEHNIEEGEEQLTVHASSKLETKALTVSTSSTSLEMEPMQTINMQAMLFGL